MTRPRSRASAGLPPITPDQVVDAAVRLTVRDGLEGWSIRQLAAELGVGAAVVYHHVGDRQKVTMAVTERVIAQVPVPGADLAWREWFGALLADVRKVAMHYHGIARQMVLLGPVVPSAREIIDEGVGVLKAAGFGDESATVYSYLVNTAFNLIAVEDDRNSRPEARLEHARMLADLADEPGNPGLAAMGEWLRERSADMGKLRAYDAEFYRYCVERALDGAQARLTAIRRRRRG
ncbi:TetR family transcriptional regulator [Allokutzneria sp. A3M-2-11 16]|uniref:TetR/AcrR family transcriptional regulator n=1 Tax=Allokutzneria sp. A3M-2-11 16 TaxID=2962043 RepID=UPI0020B7F287|nr:TetR family transcriptional regulator [Allokutzneria sp. A3M-2-11 16]MCP3801305.1 TetR family transcriptional regulator [Allokutzneria sp. A3M-2-11 16]